VAGMALLKVVVVVMATFFAGVFLAALAIAGSAPGKPLVHQREPDDDRLPEPRKHAIHLARQPS